MNFTIHDRTTAPEASKPVLEKAEKKYGFALNLFGVLADTPLDEAFQPRAWSRSGS